MLKVLITGRQYLFFFGIVIIIVVCSYAVYSFFQRDIKSNTQTHQPNTIAPESPGIRIEDNSNDSINMDSDNVELTTEYDWRQDNKIKPTVSNVWNGVNSEKDPDKSDGVNINQENDVKHTESTNTESQQYPPPNWHETKDKELYYKYYHAQLIKQFGDIKEVEIIVDVEYKNSKNLPLQIDDYIEYLEAQNRLWPDSRTEEALKQIIKIKNEEVDHNHDHIH